MTKATLLVVDDEPNLLSGIRDILELDAYRVIIAHDGRQALEALDRAGDDDLPDLIVSDIMMPYMDGISFLKEVRKRENWVMIPFIFLTAKGEKSDQRRGKMLGVDDYLVKPFDADDLLVAVDAKLRRHKAMSAAQAGVVDNVKKSIMTILNHEFRTPLTLVVAYADMLKENDVDSMNEDELLLFLREINTGADRLRRLVENFILLVELETGDASKNFEWRKMQIDDVGSILETAYEQIKEYRRSEYPCEFHINPDLPSVIGDPEHLTVAVRELMDNAIKFSNRNLPITVEAERIENDLHIRVIDQGRGIPKHELDTIWETFYQIDREHFEDQGAGSGLALVKGLTDIHRGNVRAESVYNEGSCFTIILPALV
jgi:signal transduction histidine kinase